MKAQQFILYFGLMLFLGTTFFSCVNDPNKVRQAISKSVGHDSATRVSINYSIGGLKKAVLTGPVMIRVQDTVTYVEFPQTMHVDFFDSTGKVESYLDARYARYNDGQSRVTLRDSVRVINILGDTLYSDELFWDRNRINMEFFTTKPVRIRRKTEIIDGIGMSARQDFKEWLIDQPVGFIKVPQSSFPN